VLHVPTTARTISGEKSIRILLNVDRPLLVRVLVYIEQLASDYQNPQYLLELLKLMGGRDLVHILQQQQVEEVAISSTVRRCIQLLLLTCMHSELSLVVIVLFVIACSKTRKL
jgi:hypothetical protein